MSGEKTEQPTDKKLRDARAKGEVAKSRDFTQTVLVIALFAYLIAFGERTVGELLELMAMPARFIGVDFRQAVSMLLQETLEAAALMLVPVVLIVLVLGIFVEAAQTGMNISFEALKPSAKKLNVVANAKNIFSKNNLVEFVKNLLKVAILTFVIYLLIRHSLGMLLAIPYEGMQNLGLLLTELLKQMMIYIAIAYLVLASADLFWQRHQYRKKLMMSKSEVKQEYKSSEGDPLIKSQRRGLYMELMSGNAVDSARNATVLVTNPTHLAVALKYEDGQTPLPLVLAKGEGALAQQMMDAAREAGVPVMQNIPLARALFENAEPQQYIPSDLVEPVAEVLKLVASMRGSGQPGG